VANAFTIRNMYCLLLYMKCNSRKINRPTKNMTKIVTLVHFCVVLRSAVKFSSSLVKMLRRISVETRFKGYRYFGIERDFFNNLGVLIDGVRSFASFVNCFPQNWSIDTFKHKTDKYSVHFQEMPGFKGKRKGRLTLTLYKKTFRYTMFNRSPQAGKRENLQFVDLSRLHFTSDESEFIPDYI
jgi:hypothetical protein